MGADLPSKPTARDWVSGRRIPAHNLRFNVRWGDSVFTGAGCAQVRRARAKFRVPTTKSASTSHGTRFVQRSASSLLRSGSPKYCVLVLYVQQLVWACARAAGSRLFVVVSSGLKLQSNQFCRMAILTASSCECTSSFINTERICVRTVTTDV